MQYVAIKKEIKNNEEIFVVNAIPLKNKNKSIVQKIPHPLGSDGMEFKTLEEAKDAITRAGFSYILPDGKKETKIPQKINKITYTENNYEELIYNAIKEKTNSANSNVCASAILAISEFPKDETFEIIFSKFGEDNDLVRKNAISGVCRYGKILQPKIIKTLESQNWIAKNSAISCISNLATNADIELEKFIVPLINATNDSNPIVQTNALQALAIVYQNYKKNQKI